jgi:hypothetical protein
MGITSIKTDQGQTNMLTILSSMSIWRKLNPANQLKI